ncbi:MAG: DUF4339 domain-containing protein [Planctomycetota bacterium]
MASEWYYKQGDQELGPHTFRDLVEMVREETLTADVLVRPDYLDEWQRADSIVGLFHMAQRDPATLPPINAEVENAAAEDLESFLAPSEEQEPQDDIEKPGWLKRLLSIRGSKIPAIPVDTNREPHVDLIQSGTAEVGTEMQEVSVDNHPEIQHASSEVAGERTDEEPDTNSHAIAGAYSEETWSSAISAAVNRIDERAPKQVEEPEPKQIVPTITISSIDSPVLRKVLKAGGLIVCASLAIYGIVHWMGQGTLYFPLIGVCSPLMFLLYSAVSFLGILILGSLLIFISASYLRLSFKLCAVLLTTIPTALFLIQYEEDNFVIFPTRTTQPVEAKLIFPFIGECSSFAYWMYFVDLIAFIAVLTFFTAWWLEARAEDV